MTDEYGKPATAPSGTSGVSAAGVKSVVEVCCIVSEFLQEHAMTRMHGVDQFLFLFVLSLLCCSKATAHDEHDPPLLGAVYPRIAPDGESVVFAHQGAIWRIAHSGGAMLRLTDSEGFDN